KGQYKKVLALGKEAGLVSDDYIKRSKKSVSFYFSTGLLNIFGLFKRIVIPFLRLGRPMAMPITSRREAKMYVRSQVMLAAQNFIIAAHSLGFDTCPMEGFD